MVSAGAEHRSRFDGSARQAGGPERPRNEAGDGRLPVGGGLQEAREQPESNRALQAGRRSAAQWSRENPGATMAGETETMILNASFIRRSAFLVAVLSLVLAAAPDAFAQKVLGIFGSDKVSYKTFKDAAGRFELEYPSKDWNSLTTGGSAVAILSRKDQAATVVIDLARLTEQLAASEVETNEKIEIETIKEQQPTAKDFNTEIVDTKAGGRAALIKYTRVGSNGPERVLRYVVGVGQDLYRVIAVVPQASAAKHEPTLLHMVTSFKAPAN